MLSIARQSYSKLENLRQAFVLFCFVLFGLVLVKNKVGRLSHVSSVKLYMDKVCTAELLFTWCDDSDG